MFAGLADLCGGNSLELCLTQASTVGDLINAAVEQCPALQQQVFRVAVDSRYVEESHTLPDTAEVAFIPPVSGG
ncbi:MAG: MoaD/ThiS family protein [Planctomycetes bacterium]|nr:MoaD/ThiS family protein [Planctomycetota bacterium]MCP4772492.1 MoaD/ThiS family protein [Planctomycetota bacterium]MCP4860115.1 MoaD/ThiS family protein [Planctomycetota bacterium]